MHVARRARRPADLVLRVCDEHRVGAGRNVFGSPVLSVVIAGPERHPIPLGCDPMKSTVETLDDNRVKLSVEVDEETFDVAVDAAFKRIAKEVRMPGFRPGKAPRRLLEAQFGSAVGREEALREAMPEYYAQAVIEHDVDVVAPPEIEITGGQEDGPVQFDAVVEIRPSVSAAGYDGLRVEIPNPVASAEEIDEQIDNLRRNFAELSVVERAAADEDHVTIDIEATHGDEPVPGLTTTDYDYLLGSGAVVPEIDENLRGVSAGDEVEFSADHPDPEEEEPLQFSITVKEVKEAVLPDLDDEFAKANSEFETVEDLRADMADRMNTMRIQQANMAVQQNTAEALAALVTDEIPESMIENEINARIQDLVQRLQQQGMDVGAYLDGVGQTAETLAAEFREPAEQALKVDLALRSVADLQGLAPDDDRIDEVIAEMAGPSGQDPDELKARLAEVGQISALRADLAKQAAMEWLTDNVELVDEDGEAIDREALEFPARGAEEDSEEEE
ncbi:MAG TPA: trigger factor [Acidimicrobiaceae bacterium]|nr:trigger factor [Acidimicrobiaceae bacterium]